MAIAGRAARACDVCGFERARWFCAADEAYLCEWCDCAVHGANALALRHERVRLASSGVPMKMNRSASDSFVSRELCKKGQKLPAEVESTRTLNKSSRSCSLFGGNPDVPPTVSRRRAKLASIQSSAHKVKMEQVQDNLKLYSNKGSVDVMECDSMVESSCKAKVIGDLAQEFIVPDQNDVNHFLSSGAGLSIGMDCSMGAVIEDVIPDMEGLEDLNLDVSDNRGLSEGEYCIDLTDVVSLREHVSDAENEVVSQSTQGCDSMVRLNGRAKDETGSPTLEVPILHCTVGGLNKDNLRHAPSLRLNYDDVLSAWSGRGTLWTEDCNAQTVPDDFGSDVVSSDVGLVPDILSAKDGEQSFPMLMLSLGDENANVGAAREARVMRYREKRRTRLFSKKIRYEVRKLNAERRPRMKGRFVKRSLGHEL